MDDIPYISASFAINPFRAFLAVLTSFAIIIMNLSFVYRPLLTVDYYYYSLLFSLFSSTVSMFLLYSRITPAFSLLIDLLTYLSVSPALEVPYVNTRVFTNSIPAWAGWLTRPSCDQFFTVCS